MLRVFLCMMLALVGSVGCDPGPAEVPNATGPQPPGAVVKTTEQRIAPLIAMLKREGDDKKNGWAADGLGDAGAAAKAALPDLKEVAENHKDPKVKAKAAAAIEKINAAGGAGGAATAEK